MKVNNHTTREEVLEYAKENGKDATIELIENAKMDYLLKSDLMLWVEFNA